jgi:acetyl-CoA carboxylase biotin carboxylase subunit
MIKRLLVANRGEIAIRVLRACRDLGIRGIAVFSEADRRSMHVRYANEAYDIGPAPAIESYLNIDRIIAVAKRGRVDAIHPGYGFLAENPDFAEACAREGITFVGPSPRSMRLLGDKIEARRVMQAAGVPVVPGTEGITGLDEAAAAANAIGYPVLIKAAAGGGGRGIRTVRNEAALARALEGAISESQAAFGKSEVYVEKLLAPVRHVEVQIIADSFGNVISLNERECSLQRRHQKMIEESPSPAVDEALRARLNAAAVLAARSADYVNVGTVEFLLDASHSFYFLEMNTRLQVEHPVTEMVTGFDLVADQIRIASGLPIGYGQDAVMRRGWAIECRIVAEDPREGFLPSVGSIEFAQEPAGPGVRVESALYDGFEVSPYYDSLVAKVTAWGRDRQEAIRRMRRALGEFKIVGVRTNIPMHQAVMHSEDFLAGRLDTTFLETSVDLGAQEPSPAQETAALSAAAVLAYLGSGNEHASRQDVRALGDGASPWRVQQRRGGLSSAAGPRTNGWRSAAREATG